MKSLTNSELNAVLPLASCPVGSMEQELWRHWYVEQLAQRSKAACGIGDELTVKQIYQRLYLHNAIQLLKELFPNEKQVVVDLNTP